jgi:hypothetical protein
MLRLAIQPPQQSSPGVPLYPPLAARLSSETCIFSELSQTWAITTLIHYSGEVLYDRLGGKIADSAHPLPGIGGGTSSMSGASAENSERDRAYFYFPDLVIHEPGRYRVRVSLMQMDYSHDGSPEGVVKVLESIDSRSITVEDGAVNRSRLSKRI